MLKWIRHTARLMASALAARRIIWLAEPAQAGGYNVTLERVVVRAHAISADRGVRKMAWTRMTATRALSMGAALAAGLMLATAAQARYTAVDTSKPDPKTGKQMNVYWHFGGYCDIVFTGECGNAYTLPYKVTFAGQTTDQLLIRNDGKVQFVGTKLSPPHFTANQFNIIQPIDTGIAGDGTFREIASVGLHPYYLLKEVSPGCQPFGCKNPDADYNIKTSTVVVTWFHCFNSSGSPGSCFTNLHTLTLTPTARGLSLVFDGGPMKDRVIPATFDLAFGVPEPSTWALFVLGFGGIGATLRSRRRTHLQAA